MGYIFATGTLTNPRPKTGMRFYIQSDPLDVILDRLMAKGKQNWDELDRDEFDICSSRTKERLEQLELKEEWVESELVEFYICKRAMEIILSKGEII